MPDTFLSAIDWQCSSEPEISRNVHGDDLWPVGGNFDTLTDGEHPFLAVGRVATRPHNVVGVVVTYDSANDVVVMNVAPGYVAKAYVSNVTGYSGEATPNNWAATIDIGTPVYVDDDAYVAGAGVTLTLSPVNGAGGDNPFAGIAFYDQREDEDVGVGGGNVDAWPKSFEDGSSTHYLTICVMLWPDVSSNAV